MNANKAIISKLSKKKELLLQTFVYCIIICLSDIIPVSVNKGNRDKDIYMHIYF